MAGLVYVVLMIGIVTMPVNGGVQEFMDHLNREKYSYIEPPSDTKSTQLRLGIYVNSVSAISPKTMDFRLSFYLRQSWRDPRLVFNSADHRGKTSLQLPRELWKKLWRPDVFFRNEKYAIQHDVTVPNTLFRVNTTGHVWHVIKYTVTFSCSMKLQKYPFDTQSCPMLFESFALTNDTLHFSWMDTPVTIDPYVQLPQFSLIDNILHDCSQTYSAGSFPCLEIRFVFRRDVGYTVMQVFLPTLLVVAASWLGFWFDPAAVTVRGLVGLLTLLSLITQGAATTDALPQVSYVKAIDVWLGVCLLFVFGSLVELAVISVLGRRQGAEAAKEGAEAAKAGAEGGSVGRICARIDLVCRIAFPAAFLLFCIIYFSLFSA